MSEFFVASVKDKKIHSSRVGLPIAELFLWATLFARSVLVAATDGGELGGQLLDEDWLRKVEAEPAGVDAPDKVEINYD